MKAIRRNVNRRARSIALFEVGTVFRMVDGKPEERPTAAFAVTGAAEDGWTGSRDFDFFDAKGVVEALMADLGISWSLGQAVGAAFHPGRSATVLVDGQPVGVVGELHPGVVASFDVTGRIAAGELEVGALMRVASKRVGSHDVPRFPPIRRDVSFVLDERIPHAALEEAIREAGGALLTSCVLFDVHQGPPLPAGKKSLAFSIDFRDPSRTLEREEADEAIERIRVRVREDLGGELRSG
jgi:phenylalanyl-tRNA synthetase beta chain